MSLMRRERRDLGDPGQPSIPRRGSGALVGNVRVTADSAMRMSAVWAALRLRADLVSTMPLNVLRDQGGVTVTLPKPPVLVSPGWQGQSIIEWLYASQIDLDRYGNAFGIITGRDGLALPARIELVAAGSVVVKMKGGELSYRIGGTDYKPEDVWHERAYPVSGSPVGLSPIAFAASTIGRYMAADQFAAQWFAGGQVPKGHLKNTQRNVSPKEALVAKGRFTRIFEDGGVFVSGSDWEYNPIQAESNDQSFLDSMGASTTDIARFLGVPGDLIDAPNVGSSLTYANISQRNLQFLIMHLGPALRRRADAISRGMLAGRRYAEFDASSVLLQMDPETAATVMGMKIDKKVLTVDEARAMENRPPLSDADYMQNYKLFPPRGTAYGADDELILPWTHAIPAAAAPTPDGNAK